MNEMNDEKLREMLKRTMPKMADAELEGDLWPRMLRKLDQRPAGVFWLDWLLAALLAVWCLIFPSAIPGLVYHL